MSTLALAVCLVTIVGLWALAKYLQDKRAERAGNAFRSRNAWMARRTARAAKAACLLRADALRAARQATGEQR